MRAILVVSLLLLSILLTVSGHPHSRLGDLTNPDVFLQADPYSIEVNDYHPVKLQPYQPQQPMTYYSYHIHGYFLASNVNQTNEAVALRNSFIQKFNVQECAGECSTTCPTICHWDLNMEARGPHPIASFGFYVPLEQMLEAQNFISMNHGSLSILIHPNSGYPIIDHSLNPMWIKQILPLDLSQLDPYAPPNTTSSLF